MRDHIKILGILNIVLGSFSAVAGIVVLIVMTGAAGVITAALHSANDSDLQNGAVAAPIVAALGIGVGLFLILISLPSIVGGWALINFKPWSRTLMLIVSAFHLFSIPFGTALGIYGFWVLLNRDSERLLQSGGQAYGPSTFSAAPGVPMHSSPAGYPPASYPAPNYPPPQNYPSSNVPPSNYPPAGPPQS